MAILARLVCMIATVGGLFFFVLVATSNDWGGSSNGHANIWAAIAAGLAGMFLGKFMGDMVVGKPPKD